MEAPPLMRAKVHTAVALGHAEDCYQLLGHPWGPTLAAELITDLKPQLDQLHSLLPFEKPDETATRRRVLAAIVLCSREANFRQLALAYPEEVLRSLATADEGPVSQQLTSAARRQLQGVNQLVLRLGCDQGEEQLLRAALESGCDCNDYDVQMLIGDAVAERRLPARVLFLLSAEQQAAVYCALPSQQRHEFLSICTPIGLGVLYEELAEEEQERMVHAMDSGARAALFGVLQTERSKKGLLGHVRSDSEIRELIGGLSVKDKPAMVALLGAEQQETLLCSMTLQERAQMVEPMSSHQHAQLLIGLVSAERKAATFELLTGDQQLAVLPLLPAEHQALLFASLTLEGRKFMIDAGSSGSLGQLFGALNRADYGKMLVLLSDGQLTAMFTAMSCVNKAILFTSLSPSQQTHVLLGAPPQEQADLFAGLDLRGQAALLDQLPATAAADMYTVQLPAQRLQLLQVASVTTQLAILWQLKAPMQAALLKTLEGGGGHQQMWEQLRHSGDTDRCKLMLSRLTTAAVTALWQTQTAAGSKQEMVQFMSGQEKATLFKALAAADRIEMVSTLQVSEQSDLFSQSDQGEQPNDESHRQAVLAAMPRAEARGALLQILTPRRRQMLVGALEVPAKAALFCCVRGEAQEQLANGLSGQEAAGTYKLLDGALRQKLVQQLSSEALAAMLVAGSPREGAALMQTLSAQKKAAALGKLPTELRNQLLLLSFDAAGTATMLAAAADASQCKQLLGAFGLTQMKQLIVCGAPSELSKIVPAMGGQVQQQLVHELSGPAIATMLTAMSATNHAELLCTLSAPLQNKMMASMSTLQKAQLFVATAAEQRAAMVSSLGSSTQMQMWQSLPTDGGLRSALLSLCDKSLLLQSAIASEEVELVTQLLDQGADAAGAGVLQLTPLQLCAVSSSSTAQMAQALSCGRSVQSSQPSALALATRNPQAGSALQWLADQASGLELWDAVWQQTAAEPVRSQLLNKIDISCTFGSAYHEQAAVAALLQQPAAKPTAAQAQLRAEGRRLVHWTLYANKGALLEQLLNHTADVAQLVKWACEWSHVDVAVHHSLLQRAAPEACSAAVLSRAAELHNRHFLQAAADCGMRAPASVAAGWDAHFAADLSSVCSVAARVTRYVEVKWFRVSELARFAKGSPVTAPPADAKIEPGKFGSLWYWSSLMSALGAQGASSYTVSALSEAIDRGSDPLERILLQPCAAMAHKLSTVWPSEGSSEQWLAEQFMQHEADEALVGKQREAKVLHPIAALVSYPQTVLMHYWVACESDCASTDEHVLSCCIQAEHSTTLRLTLSSSATGEAFLCDKLEITDTEQPVCFELLLQRSYFMDDGPLQLTLEQAGQMECSTNAMSVAFWSKGSTLTVTQSNASNL